MKPIHIYVVVLSSLSCCAQTSRAKGASDTATSATEVFSNSLSDPLALYHITKPVPIVHSGKQTQKQ